MTLTALVGATGGAGTTRTAVEFAAALARDGRTVAVIDTAYATQGLAEYVEGRISADVTALALDPDRPLSDATYELVGRDDVRSANGAETDETDDAANGAENGPTDTAGTGNSTADGPDDTTNGAGDESSDATAGRAVAVPAAAAFERFARAKSADASERLETRLRAATDRFDHVICDVPPVGANPHVAAVTTADRRVAVAPGTDHGADARRRLADRLADLDCTLDATLAVGDSIPAADATIPDGPPSVADAPATLHDPRFAERVIAAAETTLGVTCDVTVERDGPLDRVRDAI